MSQNINELTVLVQPSHEALLVAAQQAIDESWQPLGAAQMVWDSESTVVWHLTMVKYGTQKSGYNLDAFS